ncbi:MAG: hypothetical protein QOJ39_1119 [Candidatus Eremiobacteraeota bacterium]|jgi:hypothetical protein|nr:hypothetical protein [Candidatus Eremiobacteraeota bacterium]MEA2719255.1 hypothetical protein [Candidatus Eremiobacteraeota bacterium]
MQLLERIDIDRMLGDVLASGMPPGRPSPNDPGGGDAPDSGHGSEEDAGEDDEEATPS